MTTQTIATATRLDLTDELARLAAIPAAVREGSARWLHLSQLYTEQVADEYSDGTVNMLADLMHHLMMNDDDFDVLVTEAKRVVAADLSR